MQVKRERKTLWLAVLASLFLHVIVALSLAAFSNNSAPLALDEDRPVELTVVDLSATPPPSKPTNPPFIANDPAREAKEKPRDAMFESNANSLAASTSAAKGDALLPSQEGKERPFVQMQTQDFSLPTKEDRAQPDLKPTPPPRPSVAPNPVPTPSARPSETPKSSATPKLEPTATPEPERLAMLTATPPPALRAPEVESTPLPDLPPSPPPVTSRPRPEQPSSSYQPETQQTRITGRISDRGPRASVDAVGSPLGKYQKTVSDAIGARWYYHMKDKIDLVSIGTAHVEAEVDGKGKIRNLRVLSNDANEAFANICLQSFQEAQIPPIPPDLIGALPQGKLPVDIFFTTYANQ